MMGVDIFIEELLNVIHNYKTVYGMGMPGMPITNANITEKVNQDKLKPASKRWWTPTREARIRALVGKGYFGFDCICYIKTILWGWSGDHSKRLGGAKYLSNRVPDVGADHTNNALGLEKSTDFSKIKKGHYVWLKGHIGVYIGDGLVVEASPKWKNGAQITALGNVGTKTGYNSRIWTTHGKLPWVDYQNSDVENDGGGKLMLSRTLLHGMEGEDVRLVQEFLKNRGFYTGVLDGKFGPGQGFLNSVKAFQKAEGLEVDGKIGPLTRKRIIDLMITKPSEPVIDIAKIETLEKKIELLENTVASLQISSKKLGDNLAKAKLLAKEISEIK